MKLLLLNTYYHPEITSSDYISENRIEKFAEAGISMEMLTPTPSRNVDKLIHKQYKDKSRKNEYRYGGKLVIYRFSMFQESHSCLLRTLRYLLVNINHFFRGLNATDIDCIFCTSTPPTTALVAALLKKIKKTQFVYNVQDIFPDSLVATGLSKKGSLIWKIGHKMESYIYRNADKIIVISEDFRQNLLNKGVPDEKIRVVYNWVDQSIVKPVAKKDNYLYDKLGISRDIFTVVYAGNMGYAQNIDIILTVAKQLTEYKIQFLLFGKGPLKGKFEKEVKSLKLKNVHFLPFQSYEKVGHVYSMGDVGIVSCKKGFGGSAMPSKTWSIMASGTAVIANFDEGELKNIVETCNCGSFSKAEDADSLRTTILTYFNNPTLCKSNGNNGIRAVKENFSREAGTAKYLEIIQEIYK